MSMFSTGLSGLNTAQRALGATSNNISNLFTPGYNRELPKLSEGNVGGGVRVDAIERQFNTYVANQLNNAKTQSSALETYAGQISQIDNLLADREAGLSPLIQDFFSSLEDLASAPSDPASRQGVMGTADTLSAQFRSFDGYLQDMQDNINSQIKDEVTQINNTVEQIASFNREISLARARSGEAPNSLLNQRDQLISELNERMDLRLDVQDGKTYNVSLPNGQPLVTGTSSFRLEAVQADNDPERTVVGYRDGAGSTIQLSESSIKGGSLGGLMSFRAETLDKTQNQIGQLAVSLSVAFNEQHKEGVDLKGEQGGDFFSLREPQAYANLKNKGDAEVSSITFDVSNIDQLRATDYTVRFDDGQPSVTRKGSGVRLENSQAEVVGAGEFTWDPGESGGVLTFGGVKLTFDSIPNDGDRFEIQPVRRAGAGMETAFDDPSKIAAGTEGSAGDNRNALALQDLQSDRSVVGGSASLSGAYGAMVSDVGNRTNITQVNLDARQGLTDQLRAVQQSESGVNLNEEAANLIRYQQFYAANARVIDTAGTLLDTILNLRS
ncbi:flagellar hook-associated protein FlgK [Vreelandella sp. EE27]